MNHLVHVTPTHLPDLKRRDLAFQDGRSERDSAVEFVAFRGAESVNQNTRQLIKTFVACKVAPGGNEHKRCQVARVTTGNHRRNS